MNAILIGLTAIALLSLWDSKLISPITLALSKRVFELGGHSLSYFLDCHYCKGFWLCVIGGIILQDPWLILPAYGVCVIGLAVQNE